MITVEEAANRLYICWALTHGRPWPGGCKPKVRPPTSCGLQRRSA